MKTPQELIGSLLMYGVAVLVAIGLLWWFGDSVIDAIRAPVKRELATAVDSNASLAKDNQRLETQNKQLDRLLSTRSTFEKGVKRDLGVIGKTLQDLKKNNSRVKAWAETEIPVEVLQ